MPQSRKKVQNIEFSEKKIKDNFQKISRHFYVFLRASSFQSAINTFPAQIIGSSHFE